jgi:RimJ/RimL family protein N-acetyltransferase
MRAPHVGARLGLVCSCAAGAMAQTRLFSRGGRSRAASFMSARSPESMPPRPDTWIAADGTIVIIRPVRATDLALVQEFVDALSADTRYQRLMSTRQPSIEELRRRTDIDYEREFALFATMRVQRRERLLGVARFVTLSTPGDAEGAIVLRDDWQGHGLGTRLLASLLAEAKHRGVRRMIGTTLSANNAMLALARKFGFELARDEGAATVTSLKLDLQTECA